MTSKVKGKGRGRGRTLKKADTVASPCPERAVHRGEGKAEGDVSASDKGRFQDADVDEVDDHGDVIEPTDDVTGKPPGEPVAKQGSASPVTQSPGKPSLTSSEPVDDK